MDPSHNEKITPYILNHIFVKCVDAAMCASELFFILEKVIEQAY
jgi:hypothetical protein